MRIETIAIIGATELGCKFAALSLRAGCRTILEDISMTALERAAIAFGDLSDTNSGETDRGGTTMPCSAAAAATVAPKQADAGKRFILAHSVEDAIRDAELIIETVADELELKLELFTIFDKFAKPGALFATTTTSLSIADLADMTFCPERCIGLRTPAGRDDSRTLQVVRTTVTSDETMAACRELAQRMNLSVELLHPRAAAG